MSQVIVAPLPVVVSEFFGDREVVHCNHCGLVQFATKKRLCLKCHLSLDKAPEEESVPKEETASQQTTKQTTFNSESLAMELKTRRRILGLSQRQLAERMRCPRTYISKIENGKATPKPKSLCRIAVFLETSPGLLLDGTSTFFAAPYEIEIIELLRLLGEAERMQIEKEILVILSKKCK